MFEANQVLKFGPFLLYPSQRTLFDGERPLRLGSRSFDLLVALCEKAGNVVSYQLLLAAAWPNRVVEEGSLRVHIAALRKVLRDGQNGRRYITNVPLRGYCFVAPLEVEAVASSSPFPLESQRVPGDGGALATHRQLPANLVRLVGRDREVTELMGRLQEQRCVTLVGAGGIGKTSVALEVASNLQESEGFEVVLVELASISSAQLVPMSIASALGIVVSDAEPLQAITAFLRGRKQVLVVLDNCEHLIDAVATVAEHILIHAPDTHVLATSREALRIQGEWIQRLNSLAMPPLDHCCGAQEALGYSSVQLFVERVEAGASVFDFNDVDAPLVCSICRRLDGIPLAIELAAAAVDLVGLAGLSDGLGSRLALLGRGRRTALPRHQTLRATLDWGFELLSNDEQELLVRLSIFRGAFTHEAALAVSGQSLQLMDASLAGLVLKSLLATELVGDAINYRLLETTREYASEKLGMAGKLDEVAKVHALYMQALLRRAEGERSESAQAKWAVAHACWVDDLRAAVHWSFASEASLCLGVSLMAWSAPLWFALSLMSEYRSLAERALSIIDASSPEELDPVDEMRLCEALGHALWHTRGGGAAMASCFRRALAIADRLQDKSYQMRCTWGLWLICNTVGDYAGSRGLAMKFGEIAEGVEDPSAQLTHERMMSLGLHFYGNQQLSRQFARRVLEHPLTINHTARNSGFQFDQRVAALTVMSRILWIQGMPEQALQHANDAVEEALAIDHALSLCYAIANGAGPVSFWCGDMKRAKAWTALLRARADERSLYFWQAFAGAFQYLIDLEHDLKPSPQVLSNPAVGTLLRETLSTVRPELVEPKLIERALKGESGWCTAELLRLEGERLVASNDLEGGAELYRRAIDVAVTQDALSWELRCCMSNARLWRLQRQVDKAREELGSTLSRFHEGFDTRDLRAAKALLKSLA